MLRAHYGTGKVPSYTKVDMYLYEMSAPLWELLPQYLFSTSEISQTEWWNRTYEENLIPVVALGTEGRLKRAPIS
jgi:hypothetical protein